MIFVEQTSNLEGKKPTALQEAALRRVVATNGGGLSKHEYSKHVWQGLINRGLVQGKAGSGERVVHTKMGMEYIRKMEAA